MPSLQFFTLLGVYVDHHFLDQELCGQICAEMRASRLIAGDVINSDKPFGQVDLDVRRVNESIVSTAAQNEVYDRLTALRPKLEHHFETTLTDCEDIQFLLYGPGDFFLPHQDKSDYPGKSGNASKRQISVVVFLNSAAKTSSAGTYSGGELKIYGLLPGKEWEKCGFPVSVKTGALVGFRSDVIHEVAPVITGNRYTIVSWYY
jgi:predicted 2-oxoglutarate/Fe(II)-dependent dioxygenase YbiX